MTPTLPHFYKIRDYCTLSMFLDLWLTPNAAQSHLISSVSTDPAGKCHTVTATKPGHHNRTLRASSAVTSSQVCRLHNG